MKEHVDYVKAVSSAVRSQQDCLKSKLSNVNLELIEPDVHQPPLEMTLDEAYEKTGGFGLFQIVMTVLGYLVRDFGIVLYISSSISMKKQQYECTTGAPDSIWQSCDTDYIC